MAKMGKPKVTIDEQTTDPYPVEERRLDRMEKLVLQQQETVGALG